MRVSSVLHIFCASSSDLSVCIWPNAYCACVSSPLCHMATACCAMPCRGFVPKQIRVPQGVVTQQEALPVQPCPASKGARCPLSQSESECRTCGVWHALACGAGSAAGVSYVWHWGAPVSYSRRRRYMAEEIVAAWFWFGYMLSLACACRCRTIIAVG